MEDSKIIELFFERSEQAITELSEKYGNLFRKVASNILNDRGDTDECLNDAYWGAWNTIPPNSPRHLKAYVCRIVRNTALKRYHSNTAAKRNCYYDASLAELEDCLGSLRSAEDEYTIKSLSEALDNFLDTLDTENRVMFVRRYWYCDSIGQISERLSMTDRCVTVRLSRIREKLKKYLKKEGFDL